MGTLGRMVWIGVIMVAAANALVAAPSIDGLLATKINAAPLGLTPVVITFDHKPANSDFVMLQSLGIRGGRFLNELPIVLTSINRTQLNALKTKAGIRSLYANRTFKLLDFEGRTITGVEQLIRDVEATTRNGGLPVTGKNIGVAYIDTGIDATHPDLRARAKRYPKCLFRDGQSAGRAASGFPAGRGRKRADVRHRRRTWYVRGRRDGRNGRRFRAAAIREWLPEQS